MSLEKQILTDKIEIVNLPDNTSVVQVREVTNILENGTVISTSNFRYTVSAGEDYSDKDEKVRAICDIVFAD